MQNDKKESEFLQQLQQHKGIIIKVCNSYCSKISEKDDLAQEIVFNLWKAYKAYLPNFKFSTWMYRIAINVAVSFYRKEKRSLQFSPFRENLIVFNDESNKGVELDGNLNLLHGFIQELKEIDKSIMLLYLDDKNYKEIAEIIGISESNVGTKINRIKTHLKSKLSNN